MTTLYYRLTAESEEEFRKPLGIRRVHLASFRLRVDDCVVFWVHIDENRQTAWNTDIA